MQTSAMPQNRLRFTLLILVLFMLAIMATVASAITIVVDGDREAAWDGIGGQTPGSILDLNEVGINDNVDIQEFQWTNDQNNFYYLIRVWAAAPLMPALAPVNICLDTDNAVGTDIPVSNAIYRDRCAYASGVTGIDTIVEAYRLANGTTFVDVYNATTDPMTYLGAGTLGYAPGATNPVVEISVPLALLGYGSGNCPGTIPTVVYYDGGDTNNDDNLPDTGSINTNCGLPTAVTLANTQASPLSGNNSALPLLAVVLFGLTGMAIFAARRQTQ